MTLDRNQAVGGQPRGNHPLQTQPFGNEPVVPAASVAKRLGRIALIGSVALLGACAHTAQRAPQPTVPLGAAFSTAADAQQGADRTTQQTEHDARWWRTWDDPALSALVETALDQNLDLQAAASRIAQAEAVLTQQRSGLLPSLDFNARASRAKNIFFLGTMPVPSTTNQFNVSLAAAYELDLWGRVRNNATAANLDAAAAVFDRAALQQTVAAQVAENWLSLIEINARLALTRDQVSTNDRYLELTRLRFERGAGSIVAIRQQEQQNFGVAAQAPLLEAQAAVLRNSLATLTGRSPGAGLPPLPASLPVPQDMPALGVPADLLLNRPDVQAARLRVVAQDHRVGAAIADRLPALRLSADTGYNGQSTSMLFDDLIWSIAAGIVGPIFDAGRRKAEVTRQEAALEEALLRFTQTTITAIAEVENALAQEAAQRRHLTALESRLEASRSLLDAARDRYANGLSDYLPVLTALTVLQSDEQSVVSAQRQLLSFRVQLHRALGGSLGGTLRGTPGGTLHAVPNQSAEIADHRPPTTDP